MEMTELPMREKITISQRRGKPLRVLIRKPSIIKLIYVTKPLKRTNPAVLQSATLGF